MKYISLLGLPSCFNLFSHSLLENLFKTFIDAITNALEVFVGFIDRHSKILRGLDDECINVCQIKTMIVAHAKRNEEFFGWGLDLLVGLSTLMRTVEMNC